jgi:hypothetical protein
MSLLRTDWAYFDGRTSAMLWEYVKRLESQARLSGPLPTRRPEVNAAIDDLRQSAAVSPSTRHVSATSRDVERASTCDPENVSTQAAADLFGLGAKQARRILTDAGIQPVDPAQRRWRWRRTEVTALAAARRT